MIHSPRGPFARVILVDYGVFLDDVPVRVDVRELPRTMRMRPQPLAFQLVLAGEKEVIFFFVWRGGSFISVTVKSR